MIYLETLFDMRSPGMHPCLLAVTSKYFVSVHVELVIVVSGVLLLSACEKSYSRN